MSRRFGTSRVSTGCRTMLISKPSQRGSTWFRWLVMYGPIWLTIPSVTRSSLMILFHELGRFWSAMSSWFPITFILHILRMVSSGEPHPTRRRRPSPFRRLQRRREPLRLDEIDRRRKRRVVFPPATGCPRARRRGECLRADLGPVRVLLAPLHPDRVGSVHHTINGQLERVRPVLDTPTVEHHPVRPHEHHQSLRGEKVTPHPCTQDRQPELFQVIDVERVAVGVEPFDYAFGLLRWQPSGQQSPPTVGWLVGQCVEPFAGGDRGEGVLLPVAANRDLAALWERGDAHCVLVFRVVDLADPVFLDWARRYSRLAGMLGSTGCHRVSRDSMIGSRCSTSRGSPSLGIRNRRLSVIASVRVRVASTKYSTAHCCP